MSYLRLRALSLALLFPGAAHIDAAPSDAYPFHWSTVVNNGDFMPTDACDPLDPEAASPPCRRFNSYNQPSVNANGLVVMRARSRGGQGGEPVHGVYSRDMTAGGPVIRILDRGGAVPQPNNTQATFIEPPSFPRIDIRSDTIATRGNHQPVWTYQTGEDETRAGTTGIYANPFGPLVTGASKLGGVPEFAFFDVPEQPGVPFDVFPGAPAVTDATTLVFKGNYTVDGVGKTGVYYRKLTDAPILADGTELSPAAGSSPVVLIANNSTTYIPGTTAVFGSTAPPSAANRMAVFAGFDNEDAPTLGGIYLAPLTGPQPPLTTLVAIGQQVPGEETGARFNRLGEGVSFDGRLVAFWGAWGEETRAVTLYCPTEGNKPRIEFCNEQHPGGFAVDIPVHQGFFVIDIRTRKLHAVARTPTDYDDFLYWNFSGRVPGVGEGGEEGDDDGELARWRAAAFVAVTGDGANFQAAFKAHRGISDAASSDGIYLRSGPNKATTVTVIETGMDGMLLDPEAIDDTQMPLPVTEVGIERDGLRGSNLVINASMGGEETGWAGVYLTDVKKIRK